MSSSEDNENFDSALEASQASKGRRDTQRAMRKMQMEREAEELITAGRGVRASKARLMQNPVWEKRKTRHKSPQEENGPADEDVDRDSKRPRASKKENREQKQGSTHRGKSQRGGGTKAIGAYLKVTSKATDKNQLRESRKVSQPDSHSSESYSNDDDEGSEGSDEASQSDTGLPQMASETQLNQIFMAEAPTKHGSAELFDIDDEDVTYASKPRRSRPRSPSLSRSRFSEDEDHKAVRPQQHKLKETPKDSERPKSRKQNEQKLFLERPLMTEKQANPIGTRTKKTASARHSSDSNISELYSSQSRMSTTSRGSSEVRQAQLDLDEGGENKWASVTNLRGKGLLQQNLTVRMVCKEAIKLAEITLITEDAWPELHRAPEYRLEVLTAAAKLRAKAHPEDAEAINAVRKRIKKDDDYAKILGKWVIDRLAHYRGPVRSTALDQIAVFQLGIDKICQQRVQALLDSDTYIYPGHWGLDEAKNHKWIVKGREMYLNAAMVHILRASFFSSRDSIGYRHRDRYKSSHPNKKEPEMPMSLVALAATGIHAALDAWRGGSYIKKKSDQFNGEVYKSVYNRHMDYLHDLHDASLKAFHVIMSDLYNKVVGEVPQDDRKEVRGNAMAVFDISGYESEDDFAVETLETAKTA